jgi:hypothetical protein
MKYLRGLLSLRCGHTHISRVEARLEKFENGRLRGSANNGRCKKDFLGRQDVEVDLGRAHSVTSAAATFVRININTKPWTLKEAIISEDGYGAASSAFTSSTSAMGA